MVIAETCVPLPLCTNADAMFYSCKSKFQGEILFCTLRNVRCLVLARNTIIYNTELLIFYSIICQVVAYGRLTKERFKLLALKLVAVAYERRSHTS